jgi:hypothetical protein
MIGSEYLGRSSLGLYRSDEQHDNPTSDFSGHSALRVLCAFVGNYSPVIPAKAGIHPDCGKHKPTRWIPAFAGMTGE